MILSAHSSAEEMEASITVNDPGKCFPILRKTIQLIQSLKKTNRKQKVIFQKKESKIDIVLGNKILKERSRCKQDELWAKDKSDQEAPPTKKSKTGKAKGSKKTSGKKVQEKKAEKDSSGSDKLPNIPF